MCGPWKYPFVTAVELFDGLFLCHEFFLLSKLLLLPLAAPRWHHGSLSMIIFGSCGSRLLISRALVERYCRTFLYWSVSQSKETSFDVQKAFYRDNFRGTSKYVSFFHMSYIRVCTSFNRRSFKWKFYAKSKNPLTYLCSDNNLSSLQL